MAECICGGGIPDLPHKRWCPCWRDPGHRTFLLMLLPSGAAESDITHPPGTLGMHIEISNDTPPHLVADLAERGAIKAMRSLLAKAALA